MADAFRHLSARARRVSRGLALMTLLAWASGAAVRAQPASAAFQTVRFTIFSAQPIADVTFVPRPGGTPEKLAFQPTARSARHEYRGAMPLRFIDGTTGAVVAEALIPPSIHDALLLFSPVAASAPVVKGKSGASPRRYQISVLDDSAARLPPGTLTVLNLSGLALTGTANAGKLSLKAGLNPPLAIGPSAKVTLSTTAKNRAYQAYVGTITPGRGERALLILFPPFYKGSLEVQSRLLLDAPFGTRPANR